jgi:hypothetical protein
MAHQSLMAYRDQLVAVQRLQIMSGETRRVDCPFCGGRKTLSVTKSDGTLLWNCFRASCDAVGKKAVGRNNGEIKEYLGRATSQRARRLPRMPQIVSDVRSHPEALQYLKDNHCEQAYMDRAITVRYEPTQRRVLFYSSNQMGCVGRCMDKSVKPKWRSYGEFTSLLEVGTAPTAVLVEDAASACAVYATGKYTGVALLGTSLTLRQRDLLQNYSKVIVCLDKDASKKSLTIRGQLRGSVDTSVKFLARDLKYLTEEQIEGVLQ